MESTTNHLLVPVDYSEKSMFGLQMADNLLNISGGRLTVINILKGVDPIWSDFFTEEERQNLLLKLKKHLENFTGKYVKGGNFDVKYLICLFDTFNFRNYEKHYNIYFSSVFCVNF